MHAGVGVPLAGQGDDVRAYANVACGGESRHAQGRAWGIGSGSVACGGPPGADARRSPAERATRTTCGGTATARPTCRTRRTPRTPTRAGGRRTAASSRRRATPRSRRRRRPVPSRPCSSSSCPPSRGAPSRGARPRRTSTARSCPPGAHSHGLLRGAPVCSSTSEPNVLWLEARAGLRLHVEQQPALAGSTASTGAPRRPARDGGRVLEGLRRRRHRRDACPIADALPFRVVPRAVRLLRRRRRQPARHEEQAVHPARRADVRARDRSRAPRRCRGTPSSSRTAATTCTTTATRAIPSTRGTRGSRRRCRRILASKAYAAGGAVLRRVGLHERRATSRWGSSPSSPNARPGSRGRRRSRPRRCSGRCRRCSASRRCSGDAANAVDVAGLFDVPFPVSRALRAAGKTPRSAPLGA